MGMAASQARLLTITARLHDVEYQAQSIQNAKIALATQQDRVQAEYLAALDETTLTFKDNNGQLMTATFNNLCSPFAAQVAGNKNYIFRDKYNRIIVDDETYKLFEVFLRESDDNDPYKFALWAMTGSLETSKEDCEKYDEIKGKIEDCLPEPLNEIQESILKCEEEIAKIFDKDFYNDVQTQDILDAINGNSDIITDKAQLDELKKQYESLNNLNEQYLHRFYTTFAGDIYQELTGMDKEKLDMNRFDYYVRMFKLIQQEGGLGACVPISEFDGLDGIGNAANDSEFLNNKIKSGEFTVDQVSTNSKTGKVSTSTTSVGSDSVLAQTTTSTFDKSKLAKTEAEYEYKMKQIDRKDKAFDMDLSRLETQRNALKTEYDSVKKVISDNIERTFGIFS